jgi:hypothetical protein
LQDKEREEKSPLKRIPVEQILALQREQQEERDVKEAKRNLAFKQRGINYIPEGGITADE